MRACVGACVKSFFIPLLLLHDSVVVSLVLACLPFSLSSNVWPPLSLLPSEHFLFFVCILLQALLRFPCMSQRVRLFCVTRSTDMRIVPGRESSASCPTPTLDLRLPCPSSPGFFTGNFAPIYIYIYIYIYMQEHVDHYHRAVPLRSRFAYMFLL